MNLLYVCSGNVFRSVFAEGYTKKLLAERNITSVQVSSCGILAEKHFKIPESIKKLFELFQIKEKDLSAHIPTRISEMLLHSADLVLVMDLKQIGYIEQNFKEYRYKTFLLKEYAGFGTQPEIFDPLGQPESVYFQTAEEIKLCIDTIIAKKLPLWKGVKNDS